MASRRQKGCRSLLEGIRYPTDKSRQGNTSCSVFPTEGNILQCSPHLFSAPLAFLPPCQYNGNMLIRYTLHSWFYNIFGKNKPRLNVPVDELLWPVETMGNAFTDEQEPIKWFKREPREWLMECQCHIEFRRHADYKSWRPFDWMWSRVYVCTIIFWREEDMAYFKLRFL